MHCNLAELSSSSIFLSGFLRIFYIQDNVTTNRNFNFFLSNLDDLYFLFLPNCPAWNLQYRLNSSGESKHSCLFPVVGKIIQPFTMRYDFSCGVFIGNLYQMENVPFHSYFVYVSVVFFKSQC